MKFKFEYRKTKDSYSYEEVTIPIPNKICGLMRNNCRPQTVELNYSELKALLQNESYAIMVLTSLAMSEYEQTTST